MAQPRTEYNKHTVVPLKSDIDELGGGRVEFDANGVKLIASVFHDCGHHLECGKRSSVGLHLKICEVGVLTHSDDDSYPLKNNRRSIESQEDGTVRFVGVIDEITGVYRAEGDGRRDIGTKFDCGIKLLATIHARSEYTLLVGDVIEGNGELWLCESPDDHSSGHQ